MKIQFTTTDLARTHLAPGLNPMWEIVLSLRALRGPDGGVHARWRRQVSHQLHRARLATAVTRILIPLAGERGPALPYLTPVEGLLGLDAGIETVLRDGRDHLPDGFADALRRYHQIALAPYHDTMRTYVDSAIATATRALHDGGVEQLLDTLQDGVRWQPPYLLLQPAGDGNLHLDGTGLLLQPAYFCQDTVPPTANRTLTYPVNHARPPASTPASASTELAALLGSTRAAILYTIATSSACSTGQLARRLGLSAPTVSHHTSVLRAAGLIASQRDANTVLHTPTRLATVVLTRRISGGTQS